MGKDFFLRGKYFPRVCITISLKNNVKNTYLLNCIRLFNSFKSTGLDLVLNIDCPIRLVCLV